MSTVWPVTGAWLARSAPGERSALRLQPAPGLAVRFWSGQGCVADDDVVVEDVRRVAGRVVADLKSADSRRRLGDRLGENRLANAVEPDSQCGGRRREVERDLERMPRAGGYRDGGGDHRGWLNEIAHRKPPRCE